jgi:hypothetical protein
MAIIRRRNLPLAVVAGLALLVGMPRLWAQATTEAIAPGSLAGVTAELHQIRLAIEESTRAQTQTQAMAVYLTAQKDHILQMTTRLDALRRELDVAVAEVEQHGRAVKVFETDLASNRLPPEQHPMVTQQLEGEKRAVAITQARQQELQNRERELAQTLQAEEARWNDLISRMEQAIKR